MDASERLDEPRIALVAPEDMNAEQRELLGVDLEAGEPGQAGLSLFQLVVQHPEVLRRLKATGSFANRMTQISDRDRELMILRISWLYRSEFEWGQHYAQALDAGVTVDDAERVKDGPEAGGWNEWDPGPARRNRRPGVGLHDPHTGVGGAALRLLARGAAGIRRLPSATTRWSACSRTRSDWVWLPAGRASTAKSSGSPAGRRSGRIQPTRSPVTG